MKTQLKQRITTVPADLLQLKQQFEHWRQTRVGCNKTPPDLMKSAVNLSRLHGVTLVVKQLNLNYAAFKIQRQKIEALEKGQQEPSLKERFVEVRTTTSHQQQTQETSLAQVHCEPGGLTVLLKFPRPEDWDSLMTGYFRANLRIQEAL